MKKNIFLQTIIITLLIFLASCSLGFTTKKSTDAPEEGKAIIVISGISNFRMAEQTIMPTAQLSDLTTIVLTGTRKKKPDGTAISNPSSETLASAEKYEDLPSQIQIDPGTWNFTLTAKLKDVDFEAVLPNDIEIAGGSITPIEFELEPVSTVTKGGINLIMTLPDIVTKVNVEFKKLPDGTSQNLEFTAASLDNPIQTDENNKKYINFVKALSSDGYTSGLEPGTYSCYFEFYTDGVTESLNDITVYAKVPRGFTVASTIDIANLNDVYTINYKAYRNSADKPANLTSQSIDDLIVAGSTWTNTYTRKSTTVALPTLALTGYHFDGWYDNNDNKIDSWSQRVGNINLYAKWSSGVVNVNVTTPTEKVTLTISTPDSNGILTLTAATTTDDTTYTWYVDGVKNTNVTGNTLQFDTTGKANGVYPVTVECGGYSESTNVGIGFIGVKASPDSVGDIVFNDGSATPYSAGLSLTNEQKAAAIAVIYYKGIECSNNSYKRLLGLGLKLNNEKNTVWCSGNASSKDISTIACNAQSTGWTFVSNPDRNGSDNLEQIGTWLANNGSSDDTSNSSKYPAFHWAKNYGSMEGTNIVANSIYTTKWYLPSSIEMYKVLLCSDIINSVLSLCNFEELNLSDTHYWTSSQILNQYDRAGLIYTSGALYGLSNDGKSSFGRLCAIREF